ncbi:hypothetical protein E2562_017761 [Oryza meyeriana var. granulata]|uniref:Xylanase inhibitor C-terminal domain-containing protein n=1 Tax=Oryza meyeriana var. granulata TaxID=110450 RepID=A0A6G1BYS1_9ORYZ|nr:hypothetical protein E2562_017761 [Oryza meyeriana var. granulata]
MAKTSSLVQLLLTIAAASIDAPTFAVSDAALKKTADFLEKWKKRVEDAKDLFDIINATTDGQLLPGGGGNDAAAGLFPTAVAVNVVRAGGMDFSVAGVDVTSPVTWTSRCVGGGRSVPCGDPLCEQYGACGGCSVAAGRVCNSTAPAGVPLHKGKITLFGAAEVSSKSKEIFSRDDAAYAGNDILASAPTSFPLFSYILDSDLQGITVWLRNYAFLAATATAAQAGRRSTTRLASVGSHRSIYYVSITGIKVGSSETGGEEAVGILTTTMPFTFLTPALFDHLKQKLSSVATPVKGSDSDARFRQLCYPNGTELPVITLVFTGDAEMELQPEHYSYKQSNGTVCL